MRSRRSLAAALLTGTLVMAAHAGGQSPPPPCAPRVADQPTIDVVDLDEAKSSTLVATHSLQVSADFFAPTAAPDESSVAVSVAGATGRSPLTFSSDAPGALPVTVSWTQDDGSGRGTCSASASSTLQLAAPTPLPRLVNRLTHQKVNLKYTLGWLFGASLGPLTDHSPVVIRYRGWRKPRLPGASVPFRTVTAPLRTGDPGYRGSPRSLPLPRMSLHVTVAPDVLAVKLDSQTTTHHDRPVGYEIELTQGGRLIAHFRLAGKCSAFICNMRTVKVQL
jgi:hypothetical protein